MNRQNIACGCCTVCAGRGGSNCRLAPGAAALRSHRHRQALFVVVEIFNAHAAAALLMIAAGQLA